MLLQIVQISSKFNLKKVLENTTLKQLPQNPLSLHIILEIHFRPTLTPYRLSLIEILFFVLKNTNLTSFWRFLFMVTPLFSVNLLYYYFDSHTLLPTGQF